MVIDKGNINEGGVIGLLASSDWTQECATLATHTVGTSTFTCTVIADDTVPYDGDSQIVKDTPTLRWIRTG